MYLTCAFEVAWNSNNNVPWCSVFSLEDLLVRLVCDLNLNFEDVTKFPSVSFAIQGAGVWGRSQILLEGRLRLP
ncbi:unnamed protein product, partial [Nesidiocoris tenuis]